MAVKRSGACWRFGRAEKRTKGGARAAAIATEEALAAGRRPRRAQGARPRTPRRQCAHARRASTSAPERHGLPADRRRGRASARSPQMVFGGVADKKSEGRSPDYRSAAAGRGEPRGNGAPRAERRARELGPAPTGARSPCADRRRVIAAATVIKARVRNFADGAAPKRKAAGRRGLGAGRESYAQQRTQRPDGRAEKRTPTAGRAGS